MILQERLEMGERESFFYISNIFFITSERYVEVFAKARIVYLLRKIKEL